MTQESPQTDNADETPAISKWEDPSVPAGNAPPMPKWPLAVMLVIWVGWVGFLAAARFGIL